MKNDWHNVQISDGDYPGDFIWTNRAGVSWTITQDACDPGTFYIDDDCPYFWNEENPYRITWIEVNDFDIDGVYGPGYEYYTKVNNDVPLENKG